MAFTLRQRSVYTKNAPRGVSRKAYGFTPMAPGATLAAWTIS